MIPRIFRAREQIEEIWVDQESEGVSRTPRYLKEETSLMGDPAKTRGAKLGSREGLWEFKIACICT